MQPGQVGRPGDAAADRKQRGAQDRQVRDLRTLVHLEALQRRATPAGLHGARRSRTRLSLPRRPGDVLPHDRAGHDRRDRPAAERPAGEGRVAALRLEARGIDGALALEVEHRHVRGRADRERAPRQAEHARGMGREKRDQARQRDDAGAHEAVEAQRDRRLQAHDAEGGLVELDLLVVHRVRRVVGRDAVDRAVAQALDHRQPVGLGAQRRVHLGARCRTRCPSPPRR